MILGIMAVAGFCPASTLLVPGQYPTIQAGIDASLDGDTVLVSAGIYAEHIDFHGKRIVVKSEQGAESTVIDGNHAQTVVRFQNDEGPNSILEGFTVTNGLGGGGYPNYRGGGIDCDDSSSPTIKNNIIMGNSSPTGGGGIACEDWSNATIINNIIMDNAADDGAAIYGDHCYLTIVNNTISGNRADGFGGGIYGYYVGAIVRYNLITGNTASMKGGGMAVLEASHVSYPIWQICNNVIADNLAGNAGGGINIQCSFPAPGHTIMNNTITRNRAGLGGALALSLSAYPVITNSILWNNSQPEIHIYSGGGNPTVAYSDVTRGWPGTGNIDADPLFVDLDYRDYRLQWDSPCIDAGDPASSLDPDGTIRDMGRFYYDQSMPVRILLTPHDHPILIPAEGGSVDYTLRASNSGSMAQSVTMWCDVTLPDGGVWGPVLGPFTVTLDSGITFSRIRTQDVPGTASAGTYHFNAWGVAGADTSKDRYAFMKLGYRIQDLGFGSRSLVAGAEFPHLSPAGVRLLAERRVRGDLVIASPNPFNASTDIRYQMTDGRHVSLKVYDLAGRLVSVLTDGYREAGSHEVIFSGANLTSGIYIIRMEGGSISETRKVLLVK
jgi:hypothetical protein